MIPTCRLRSAALFPLLALLLAPVWTPTAPASAAESPDAWSVLRELRDNLAAEPKTAEFVQIFQPAGFTTGDKESGHLYLSLPGCARWDYDEPFPKVFLLCEDTIHTWNPGEQAGRRYQLTNSDEPGIDLLRLETEILRSRYDARLEADQEGSLQVVLTPRNAGQSLVEAEISMDLQRQFLLSLSYRDLEGNASRFEIGDYESLDPMGLFEPPSDLEWLDQ